MSKQIMLRVDRPRGWHIFAKASVKAAKVASGFDDFVLIRNREIRREFKKKQDVSKCQLLTHGRCRCFEL